MRFQSQRIRAVLLFYQPQMSVGTVRRTEQGVLERAFVFLQLRGVGISLMADDDG